MGRVRSWACCTASRGAVPPPTQIAEAEKEVSAYGACLAQLAGAEGGAGPGGPDDEEALLEEVSRLEQQRDAARCGLGAAQQM
jgi:hypothetical protein